MVCTVSNTPNERKNKMEKKDKLWGLMGTIHCLAGDAQKYKPDNVPAVLVAKTHIRFLCDLIDDVSLQHDCKTMNNKENQDGQT